MVNDVYRCPIVPFVYILVKVFHRTDRRADLDINVRIVLPRKIWIIGDDPSVIEGAPTLYDKASIITSPVRRVPGKEYVHNCSACKMFLLKMYVLGNLTE